MNKKRNRKLRKLITICALFAIILSVGTYAWFIGMKTVNVSPFEIEIATTEGLFLSMDGNDWYYNLNVANANQYGNNTNTWADDGLIPVSTVGEPDKASSRLKLFEKGSLTASAGGYRLLTSRVDNYSQVGDGLAQGKGYVAFDLFIKNLSGEEYYADNNPLNEEAIYLNTNSSVDVSENGGKKNAGIENSVRVAFMQVGRVSADTKTASTITGITCDDVMAGDSDTEKVVTGICRNAQIWEPNDTKHVQNAINWYNKSCDVRTGDDVNLKSSYGTGGCGEVLLDGATNTYAISKELGITDNVDVYDGTAYNTYGKNTKPQSDYVATEDKSEFKLIDMDYFTDTEKMIAGANRPAFMTLAPNSITKVRVYVFIEGQDIDNYDFASLGKQISVKFGFTKERYNQEDFPDYEGPNTHITPTSNDIVDHTEA